MFLSFFPYFRMDLYYGIHFGEFIHFCSLFYQISQDVLWSSQLLFLNFHSLLLGYNHGFPYLHKLHYFHLFNYLSNCSLCFINICSTDFGIRLCIWVFSFNSQYSRSTSSQKFPLICKLTLSKSLNCLS